MTNNIPIKIVILSYSKAQKTSVYGLIDLFYIAEYACNFLKKIEVKILSEKDDLSTFKSKLDVIIIPPNMDGIKEPTNINKIVDFLQYHYTQKTILSAICAGTFILAKTNLLNGQKATTHWMYADLLQKHFPKIIVNKNKLLIDNGILITSGGIVSWVDIGLHIVKRFFGHHIMLKVTQYMNVDPPRNLQKQYISFSPHLNHNDNAILKAQYWLMNADIHQVNVNNLIKQSGLVPRTFLRRFKKATNTLPKDYIQNFYIEYAKGLLETTNIPIQQISWDLGYENSSSFRKLFTETTCLTPREYRKKYGVKT